MSGERSSLLGQVLFGINTIYTVQAGDRLLECRIKGKVFKADARSYNPIAAGDYVEVVPDALSPAAGQIVGMRPRTTTLARWNKKGRAPQVLAANADLAVCVTSPFSPPFRPRFIDRLLVAAEVGGLSPIILVNKRDLGIPDDMEERLDSYKSMGYQVHLCSAATGDGVRECAALLAGKTAVFVGQSGVGKSSLLNALGPRLDQRVGGISVKHDRGSHTTNFAALICAGDGLRIIDTPGIRELELADIPLEEIAFHFREFSRFSRECSFQPCLHEEEPGCAVRAAAERGGISPDRYESYLRIVMELQSERRGEHG